MSYLDRALPNSRTDPRDEEFNQQLRRNQYDQEPRGHQTRKDRDPRRNGGEEGSRRGKPGGGGRRRGRDGARNRSDQKFSHHDNRGRPENPDSGLSIGLGDHCRDNSGSRDHWKREENWSEKTKVLDKRQVDVGVGEIKNELTVLM
eukprot:TRINITY_DN9740_c0_g1_i1.p1 TRINITY_DN9740_c0_g1~~TRINITY_DN9740_c0_g1_i1.p1  ORF type:complete len:146 (+),score=23.94 TRINITY_DN9740_c0_g1_i1:154-591(+)